MLNNINFTEGLKQHVLINGLIILSVIVLLSLIFLYAYVQLKKHYKKRYEVLLMAFEIEAKSFYEVMKKHNQAKAKLSDGFIFRLVELAKLADQLHLVSEDNKQRWQELLHDIYMRTWKKK